MKKFTLILSLIIFSNFLHGQWVRQYPNPTSESLDVVFFVNQYTGWIASGNGSVLKTVDGGENWIQHLGLTKGPYKFSFIDQNTGYIISDKNILKTINGGSTWDTVYHSDEYRMLYDICFTDTENGTVVGSGGLIIRTTNGGAVWNIQESGVFDDLRCVSFFDVNNGILVGGFTILKTTNGGANWFPQAGGINFPFYPRIAFLNSNNAIIVEDHRMLRTTNGGTNWIQTIYPYDYDFRSISFSDPMNGMLVKNSTSLLRTSDGGVNWTTIDFEFVNLNSIHFTDNFAFGVGSFGVTFRSTDGGITWSTTPGYTYLGFNSVFFTDINNGTVVGDSGRIYTTSNGGLNWIQRETGTFNDIHKVYYINSNTGYALGGVLLKTTDKGITWNELGSVPGSDVVFTDVNNGYIAGYDGKVLKTTNAGLDWIAVLTPSNQTLNGVAFVDNNTGVAVGKNGMLIRTTDQGETWTRIFVPTINELKSISFGDALNGIVVGYKRILKTTDGGLTWELFTTDTDLLGVSMADLNNGFASGTNGRIFRTTDGWYSWTIQTTYTSYPLRIHTLDVNNAAAVGNYLTILRTTNGGYIPVELIFFNAVVNDREVILNWITASEKNNYGFEIERSENNFDWIRIGFREGKGTTSEKHTYSFTERLDKITSAKLFYRLKQIDYDGTIEYSKVAEIEIFPVNFSLSPNYPNPFNPVTTIEFSIGRKELVNLTIYDILGRKTAEILSEEKEPGHYKVQFNGKDLSSGVYFYEMRAETFSEIRKFILIK